MATINFTTTRSEFALIKDIAERAVSLSYQMAERLVWSDVAMDITAVHAGPCRLSLTDLLRADDFNFCHDIYGIRRHLNRDTGQLERHFVPRFAQHA